MSAGEGQVRTIIVMGITGSGKSEAIRQLGGKHVETGEPPEISDGFGSCTQGVATYDIGVFGGARYQLVDTMGMLDTDGNDDEGLDSIVRLLDNLSTVVGVVYVVQGRMNPPEMETCNFLFNTLFHDLDPSKLLVLRTHVNRWEMYNAKVDKDYLKRQNGVPKRILDSNFVAVDFHPAYGPDIIRRMTPRVLQPMQSWTTPLQLSEKSNVGMLYYTSQKRVKELTNHQEELKVELANLKMSIEKLTEELLEAKRDSQKEKEKMREEREEREKERKRYQDEQEKAQKEMKELQKKTENMRRENKKLTDKIDSRPNWGAIGGVTGGGLGALCAAVVGVVGAPVVLPVLAGGVVGYGIGEMCGKGENNKKEN